MAKSVSRRERLAAKQKRDGEKKGVGNFSVLELKDHSDIPWVKLEAEKDYAFDLIPYKVTSKKHPEYAVLVEDNWLEDYKLDLWVHRGVGVSKKNLVCPNKNYGKPCPICEEHDRLKDENPEWEWGDKRLTDIRAKLRSFFNIIDLEDGNKQKFFEYSYAWFTKNLLAQAKRKSKKKEILLGDISKDGVTVEFAPEISTFDAKRAGEVKSFDFTEREEGYTEEDIENAPKLDTMVKISPYEEISDMFFGNIDEDDDDEDTTEEVVEEEVVEEEVPARKKTRNRGKDSTPVCPVDGLTFGEDVDGRKCLGDDCPLYDQCDAKYEEMN